MTHNDDWPRHARPLVEAFLHAKYFVEMMVKYGRATRRPALHVAERVGGHPHPLSVTLRHLPHTDERRAG